MFWHAASVGRRLASMQSIGAGDVEVYSRLKSSGQDWPLQGIGRDESHDKLHWRRIASIRIQRQSATNSDLTWSCPPATAIGRPATLFEVLDDGPPLAPLDRGHELRQHEQVELIPLGLLGLMSGRPGPPFSRAISSRCAATVRRGSATSSNSFSTKLFRSACERPSRSAGGDIPTVNPTRDALRIL